jgi:dihydroflavonol-4-reductase
MTGQIENGQIRTAFVTGGTGLLGNNLVRLLVSRGVKVKALVRSREKAAKQFAGLPVEIVVGEMTNVSGFAEPLGGSDVLFHTAAYFRNSFRGGQHWQELYDTNVRGTGMLLHQAYVSGIRRVVHTSSVAVLASQRGTLTDETMRRTTKHPDDYYRSKVLADREVTTFLEKHPDLWASFVLPGWMVGPGDIGPTSSGQVILDFVNRKLPGIPPSTFSLVDARDVAEAHWLAARKGRRGEGYLAAGRHTPMADLFAMLERITGVPGPRRRVATPVLYLFGAFSELWARVSGSAALLSLAMVRLMVSERERSHFDHSKSERELGLRFRPAEETLRDTIVWYEQNGWFGTNSPIQRSLGGTKAAGC